MFSIESLIDSLILLLGFVIAYGFISLPLLFVYGFVRGLLNYRNIFHLCATLYITRLIVFPWPEHWHMAHNENDNYSQLLPELFDIIIANQLIRLLFVIQMNNSELFEYLLFLAITTNKTPNSLTCFNKHLTLE